MMFTKIKEHIVHILLKFIIKTYRAIYLPIRVFQIRRKKVIKVAFILSDLGKWKTEILYNKMLQNKRFEPIILVAPYIDRDNSGIDVLCSYLERKSYFFNILDRGHKIRDYFRPDIIFYQEPYNRILDKNIRYKYNLKSLFCYVSYGFHCERNNWLLNQTLLNICWQVYYENEIALIGLDQEMTNHAKNCINTGLPMTEVYLQPILKLSSPWLDQTIKKKKIIWAPHYSINNNTAFRYSTFLIYYDFMLKLAEKYKDYIQIAFKPHPYLLTKLYEIWGKDKTDSYYSSWEKGVNTQLVIGDYVSLFMHSDALIHDSSSFTIEYHYTKNPVLYLIKDDYHADGLNELGKKAFNMHYLGRCKEDIESFVNNVIQGKDNMRKMREDFYERYLLPPDGKTASENIINAILGQ